MSGDGDRPNVVRLEVNLSRSVADALQESARLRGASLTEAIRQAIVLLHKEDVNVDKCEGCGGTEGDLLPDAEGGVVHAACDDDN